MTSAPILWRIALRTVARHKAQAIAAAAAIAVGATVLSASLSAGRSASDGITGIAYDALGEADEFVRIDGGFFFPERHADALAADAAVQGARLELAPIVLARAAAVAGPGQSEPDAILFGFSPGAVAMLGPFQPADGDARFPPPAPDGVLVNERLARAADLSPGDRLRLTVARAPDPLVPVLAFFNGTLTAPAATPIPLPGQAPAALRAEHAFDVEARDELLVAVLAWDPGPAGADLDLALDGPSGPGDANANGSRGAPDVPAALVVQRPAPGPWRATVTGEGAVETRYTLVVLRFHRSYDPDELMAALERFERVQERLPDAPLPGALRRATLNVTIAGIVEDATPPGGFLRTPAVFAPLSRVQAWLDHAGDANIVLVSNPGGVRDGTVATAEATAALEAALVRLAAAAPDDATAAALVVDPVKTQFVDQAEESGRTFTQFLVTLSAFTILAGVLLVVNVFAMLAEERRQELAVARALGLRRRDLVAGTLMEGALYAVPGAAVGAIAGIGLAWTLVAAVNRFLAAEDAIRIPFVVGPATVPVAAGATMLVALCATAATGVWLSRLHIATALKRLPNPRGARRRHGALALGAAGVLLLALALATRSYTLAVLGPSALMAAAAMWLTRRVRPERGRAAAALLVLVFGLWTIPAFQDVSETEASILGPVRSVVLVLASVTLLLNGPGLPRALRALGRRFGRRSPEVATALAYPIHRRLRSGLTATMFALVLLVLALFSTFFAIFQPDPARESGGYDVFAETTTPATSLAALASGAPPAVLSDIDVADPLWSATLFGGRAVRIDGEQPQYQGPPLDYVYGFGDAFAEHNAYALVRRHPQFATDRDAYRAVAAGAPSDGADGWAIVGRIYDFDETGRPGRVKPDSLLTLATAGGTRTYRIAGVQEQLYLAGVFIERGTMERLFPGAGGAFLIGVRDGADAASVATRLEEAYAGAGMRAESIAEATAELQAQNRQFLLVLQVFLGLGLVVGVASLGIVMAKAAVEREHELGVLRALGVSGRGLDRSLLVEAAFTATLGVVPGIVMGIVVAFAFHQGFLADENVPFRVPWRDILIISGIAYACAVLSSLPAGRRARRIDPARAVRVQL